jgi:hypothetical protein
LGHATKLRPLRFFLIIKYFQSNISTFDDVNYKYCRHILASFEN